MTSVAGLIDKAEAVRRLGVDVGTFAKWKKEGRFQAVTEKGKEYFDPEEIDLCLQTPGEQEVTVISELRLALQARDRHIERLLDLVTKPAEVFTGNMVKHYEQLAARDEKHEDRWLKVIELVEELSSEHAERVRKEREAEASEKRKDELFDMLKKLGPTLLDQAMHVDRVKRLFAGLDPEKLKFLLGQDNDFLNDVQKEDLLHLIKTYTERENDGNQEKVDPGIATGSRDSSDSSGESGTGTTTSSGRSSGRRKGGNSHRGDVGSGRGGSSGPIKED